MFSAEVVTMSSNLEAAQTGDHRKALEEARDTAAAALDRAAADGAGTVAQLLAQYRATLADLAALKDEGAQPGTGDDEFSRKRAAKDNTFDAAAI